MGKLTWQEAKAELQATRYCKKRLIESGVCKIDEKPTGNCKHKLLFKTYFEVFGTCHRSDFRTQEELKKSHVDVSYIYVIANLEFKVCKIGFSNNVHSRLTQIQTGCPFPLKIYKMFKGTMKQEKRLHQKYKDFRLSGEWFRFDGILKNNIDVMKGEVNEMIDTNKKMKWNRINNIKILKNNINETQNSTS